MYTVNEMQFTNPDERQAVLSPMIARQLIRLGYPVIDIQPDLTNPVKSIFIFHKSNELSSALDNLIKQRQLQKQLYNGK